MIYWVISTMIAESGFELMLVLWLFSNLSDAFSIKVMDVPKVWLILDWNPEF